MTGASRGLGRAVACALSSAGVHVVLAARTQGGIEETDDMIRASGGSATLCPLDLTAPRDIEDAARALGGRFGRLDILVGNAATLGILTPVHQLEADVWERVISTNVTANRRLIRAFDPWLRRSAAGRAIFVTSGAADAGLAYWGAYAASKAALEALVSSYAAETARTGIRVNLVDPGVLRTDMRARAFPGEDPSELRPPEAAAAAFVALADVGCTMHGQVVRAYG